MKIEKKKRKKEEDKEKTSGIRSNNRVIFRRVLPRLAIVSRPFHQFSLHSLFIQAYSSIWPGTGVQISSAGSHRQLNSRTVEFNWKKVNPRRRHQKAITNVRWRVPNALS